MQITITPAALANVKLTFAPVVVNRGRKFRGFGYCIAGGYTYTRGYRNSGVDPYCSTDFAKIWDPATQTIGYANCDFVEDTTVEPEKLIADKMAYIIHELTRTYDWCKANSKDPSENEVNRFARNVIRKHNDWLLEIFDANFTVTDTRNVVDEIQKTITWALSLRTRPMRLYGRWCEGGKKYSSNRYSQIIITSLRYKQIDKLPGFAEAFAKLMNDNCLPVPQNI